MRAAWLLAGFFVALTASSARASDLLITGFAFDLPGRDFDDAVELYNAGTEAVDLGRVSVGDGEGRVAFPAGSTWPAGARIVWAGNATAYQEAARGPADYHLRPVGTPRSTPETDAGLQLAKAGDQILLYLDGSVVDAVHYGDATAPGTGWTGAPIVQRGPDALRWYARNPTATGHQDTDEAADWESPRIALVGQTRFAEFPATGPVDAVAYTAPDRAREVFLDFVSKAERRLWINVYEFLDADLAQALAAQADARPGFDLRLLLDVQPVGQSREEQSRRDGLVAFLETHGATVRLLAHDRYAYDHAKYALADERYVLVQSENLVASGMSADGVTGNRGWGVVLDSPNLALQLGSVFESDFELDPHGAQAPRPENPVPPLLGPIPNPPKPRLGTARDTAATATLLVAPDQTLGLNDPIVRDLQAARSEILVEQLNLPPYWRDAGGQAWPNQYLAALVDAAERGVAVRILLDGHFVDAADNRTDNLDTVSHLLKQDLTGTIQTRLLGGPDEPVLHVKGLVIDRSRALVGSMNWNLNSISRNREVDVRLESSQLASFYADAFEADWARAPSSSTPATSVPAPGLAAFAMMITAAALWAAAERRGGSLG